MRKLEMCTTHCFLTYSTFKLRITELLRLKAGDAPESSQI